MVETCGNSWGPVGSFTEKIMNFQSFKTQTLGPGKSKMQVEPCHVFDLTKKIPKTEISEQVKQYY